MARPLRLWNFVRFVNDAVGSASKYDIIEAHWLYPAGIAAMIASKITGTPYRVFCHGTDVMMSERSWLWRFWARRVVRHAKEVFAVSHFLAIKLSLIVKRGIRIHIQPMEVDKEIFFDRHQDNRGYHPVTFINKSNAGKYESLFYDLINKGLLPDNCFLFLKGNQYSQTKLSDYFNITEVVVLASENEGYGLMLAEAAECGSKIIGVNEGGIPEVVAKYGGQLFDGTAEDLMKKIDIALNIETGAVLQ